MTQSRHHVGEPLTVSLPGRAGESAGLVVACTSARTGAAVAGVATPATWDSDLKRHSVTIPLQTMPDVLTLTMSSAARSYVETIDVRSMRMTTVEAVRSLAAGSLGDRDDPLVRWGIGAAEARIEEILCRSWGLGLRVVEGRADACGVLRLDVDARRLIRAVDLSDDTAITGVTVERERLIGLPASTWVRAVLEVGEGVPAPAELVGATAALARHLVHQLVSAIPERAERWQVLESGATVFMASPSAVSTGLPNVDAALDRYRRIGIG